MTTLTADCAACQSTYYGSAERFENDLFCACGGPLVFRLSASPAAPKPERVLTKAQRAALKRLLQLAPAQLKRLAFDASLAEQYGATDAQCVRARKKRRQLLADVETLQELINS